MPTLSIAFDFNLNPQVIIPILGLIESENLHSIPFLHTTIVQDNLDLCLTHGQLSTRPQRS